MLDDDKLESAVRDLIIDICEVLYNRGYTEVPIGAMMRLVGVGNEHAAKHDDQRFELDEEFQALLEQRKQPPVPKKAPSGVTLH